MLAKAEASLDSEALLHTQSTTAPSHSRLFHKHYTILHSFTCTPYTPCQAVPTGLKPTCPLPSLGALTSDGACPLATLV